MSKFKDKKVLVVGFGVSGVAAAKYLSKEGARVTVVDAKQKSELAESLKACSELKLEYEFGPHQSKTFLDAELIVVSPGVPLNQKVLDEARAAKIPMTTEADLAFELIQAPVIAITGTNGKTTTTVLISEMLRESGKTVFTGGNIGEPLLNYVLEGLKTDFVVAELSSFQLELIENLKPAVAVFTNLDQDHLDRYGTMEAYTEAKKKLLQLLEPNSVAVLNYDSESVRNLADGVKCKILWFTKNNPILVPGDFSEKFLGCYMMTPEAGLPISPRHSQANANQSLAPRIVAKMDQIDAFFDTSKLKLFGDHNKENVMAAACAVLSVGGNAQAVQAVMNQFKGVPHRLEFVRKKDGVYFFNDSKATNVMSLERSLAAFKKSPIILLAGGKDKGMDFSPLADAVHKKCKILILMGEAKEKLNRTLGDSCETYLVGTFEEAVLLAYQKSRSGDIILLSPGCASYDMFRNYEERGDYFKKLVLQF